MILAIDIGNSNIVIAMYHKNAWTNTFRYETKETQSEFFYENSLRNILLEWQIKASRVSQCVISSVVPDVNEIIIEAVKNVTGHSPLLLQPDVYKGLDAAGGASRNPSGPFRRAVRPIPGWPGIRR